MGCNHNFVTYQNCGESNVTASKTSEAKVSNQLRNGSHGRSQAPQRPKRTILHADCGGTAALGPVGSLAWEGRVWPPVTIGG